MFSHQSPTSKKKKKAFSPIIDVLGFCRALAQMSIQDILRKERNVYHDKVDHKLNPLNGRWEVKAL